MSERIVKARKDYQCDRCGATIAKGEKYLFGSWKEPVIVERVENGMLFEEQIGIKYSKARICLDADACNERSD